MADLNEKLQNLNNTPDTTSEYDPQDIENNKLMAILAYLSWIVIVPIVAAKESKFARFHVNQGIVLAVTELIVVVICNIFNRGFIGKLFDIIGYVLSLACVVCSLIGVLNAANGKAKELPVIGKFRIIK